MVILIKDLPREGDLVTVDYDGLSDFYAVIDRVSPKGIATLIPDPMQNPDGFTFTLEVGLSKLYPIADCLWTTTRDVCRLVYKYTGV